MREPLNELSEQKARQKKADQKIRDQENVVRKMNGTAAKHPEEQQLLNEMRGNKAALDLNLAMLDYVEEHRSEQHPDSHKRDTTDERA